MSEPNKGLTLSDVERKITLRTAVSGRSWHVLMLVLPLSLAIAAIANWGYHRIEAALKQQVAGSLQGTLFTAVTGVQTWLSTSAAAAVAAAHDAALVDVAGCIEHGGHPIICVQDAKQTIERYVVAGGFAGYRFLQANGAALIGEPTPEVLLAALRPLLQTSAQPPVSDVGAATLVGPLNLPGERPFMAMAVRVAAAPKLAQGTVLLLELPLAKFTSLLQAGRMGSTGETYAFDAHAKMISNSRFLPHLRQAGLVGPNEDSAILAVDVRDPGLDLTSGARSGVLRAQQPLTSMAQAALAGRDGFNVDGYRDYRGVIVVGAWRWLPAYRFGIATESDRTEALSPMSEVMTVYLVILLVLVLVAVGLALVGFVAARTRRRAQLAESRAAKLGQYHLIRKLGTGGMGSVYLATHAMLRRPTAIKLMRPDRMNSEHLARFEREVQRTSELSHPNTVAIFDYGRTSLGTFYYAMEYLDGLTLDALVDKFGPQPESRVIHFVRQICGSLIEAHAAGLVHRDIKPANLFLCRRGGLYDVIKVLDFGVAKGPDDVRLTRASSVVGTPEYMAPEMFDRGEKVNAQADLYSLGAVAYFLVTGHQVFDAVTLAELCTAHLNRIPEPPSALLGRSIDVTLELVILTCLAKAPNARPRGAEAVLALLERSVVATDWTQEIASAWWQREGARVSQVDGSAIASAEPMHAESL